MIAGYLGAALALRARSPSVPLPAICAACLFPDLVWLALHALGVEPFGWPPVDRLPYSHDLALACIDAGIAAAVGMLLGSFEWALALGLGVLAHVALDALVLPPVLGLGGPWLRSAVGLDLARRAPLAAWGLEMAVVLGGGAWFVARALPASRRRAAVAAACLAVFQCAMLARI